MIRRTCLILVVGSAVSLAACGDSSPAVTAPTNPHLDGGWTMGSGNQRSDTTSFIITTTEQDSTDRGGWTMGSGN